MILHISNEFYKITKRLKDFKYLKKEDKRQILIAKGFIKTAYCYLLRLYYGFNYNNNNHPQFAFF